MTKLTNKNRDAVQSLLEAHAELCAAEGKIGKRGIYASINTTNEKDDSDFVSVTIESHLAKAAVRQQKQIVAKELAKFGIEVA